MKRALMYASVASMIQQFNMSNIKLLQELGYEVDVACNFEFGSTISNEKIESLKKQLNEMNVHFYHVPIPRKITDLKNLKLSYKQTLKLMNERQYHLIHCHSPIGGVICREANKQSENYKNCRMIYTAHGFHFYDGAPLKNWLIFYPVERALSRWTDVLITINKEDYHRASEQFRAKKTVYIPGVGVDTEKFAVCKVDNKKKRRDLSVKTDDFLLLSVGELSERKNQRIIIEALGKMKTEGSLGNTVYLAVGKGDMQKTFEGLVKEYGLEGCVKFLGFRTDIAELCKTADCFVHPSVREGLGIAPLEAMAAGLPLISAKVNGIKDYTEEGVSGCCIDPESVDEMAAAIRKMDNDTGFREKCGRNNVVTARQFDINRTNEIMRNIYKERKKRIRV